MNLEPFPHSAHALELLLLDNVKLCIGDAAERPLVSTETEALLEAFLSNPS